MAKAVPPLVIPQNVKKLPARVPMDFVPMAVITDYPVKLRAEMPIVTFRVSVLELSVRLVLPM
jgi:hypothetical protein